VITEAIWNFLLMKMLYHFNGAVHI